MSTKFLTDPERIELLKKYQDDNLREAPANILDKTLITNYGSDEQKTRVADPEIGAEQKGTENQTGSDQENGGLSPENGVGAGEMKTNDNDEVKNFTKEYNRYVAIFGKAPNAKIKRSEDLRILSDKREEENLLKGTPDDPEISPTKSKGMDLIRLRNKNTGEYIFPTVFSYENFIKKNQLEFIPAPIKPKEAK